MRAADSLWLMLLCSDFASLLPEPAMSARSQSLTMIAAALLLALLAIVTVAASSPSAASDSDSASDSASVVPVARHVAAAAYAEWAHDHWSVSRHKE